MPFEEKAGGLPYSLAFCLRIASPSLTFPIEFAVVRNSPDSQFGLGIGNDSG